MRSLWRMIASRWLGGHGSDALTGDSTLLDLLVQADQTRAPAVFQVQRQSPVSHHAMMSRQDQDQRGPEPALEVESPDDRSA